MDPRIEAIRRKLKAAAPACIRALRPAAVPPQPSREDEHLAAWRIACECGETRGSLLGYSLADYAENYKGPILYISPLAFECPACRKTTEFLDSEKHGYNSEFAKQDGGVGSAAYRGKGPRIPFACPHCQGATFELTLEFAYWDGAIEVFLEQGDLPCQDYFDLAVCKGTCARCGKISTLVELDS